jgi:hypothetical protein
MWRKPLSPVFDHTSGLSVFDLSPGMGEGAGVRDSCHSGGSQNPVAASAVADRAKDIPHCGMPLRTLRAWCRFVSQYPAAFKPQAILTFSPLTCHAVQQFGIVSPSGSHGAGPPAKM